MMWRSSSIGIRIETLTREGGLENTEIIDGGRGGALLRRRPHVVPVDATLPALKGHRALLKRSADLVGACVGLVVLSPLLLLLAILVKLDSPGSVVFSQMRAGWRGRSFRMLKLRTMHTDAEDTKAAVMHLSHTEDTRLFKIHSDPRATRLGNVIRRWSLDELPQLINVLRGDMSLVGPRPFIESDLDDYEEHHFCRFAVKPGITGLWQVSGRSDIVDFEEVIRLDRYYIDNWSLALDLRILARTVPAVIGRRGAY